MADTKNAQEDASSEQEVQEKDFLTEEEQAESDAGSEQEAQPTEETDDESSPDSPSELSEEGETVEEDSEESPALFAGKFKSFDALKEAFAELGGDPDEFSDPKEMERAYSVAEKAFHHARREATTEESQQEQEQAQPSEDEQVKEVLSKVDWSKVKDASDLARETMKATMALFNRNLSLREARLAQQIQEGIETRDAVKAELASLEAKVPRLKSDKSFRNAFGYFVAGQKAARQFKGLEDAFNSFVAVAKGHGESLAQSRSAQEKQKADAHVSSESPEGLKEPRRVEDVISDNIVEASKSKNPLLKA